MDIFDHIREQLVIEEEELDEAKMGLLKRIAAKDIFKTRAHARAARQLKIAKGKYKEAATAASKTMPGKKNLELRRATNQSLVNPKKGASKLKKGFRPEDLKAKAAKVKQLRKQMIRRKLAVGGTAAVGVAGGAAYAGKKMGG